MTLSVWNQEVIVILLVFLVICSFSVFFFEKYRKLGTEEIPKGYLFLVEELFATSDDMVTKALSKRYSFLTTYFFFVFFYIGGGGFFSSLTGFPNPFANIAITFSLAFVTFMLTFIVGIGTKKWKFLKRYFNPLALVTQFTPLISLTLRLAINNKIGSLFGEKFFILFNNGFFNSFLFFIIFPFFQIIELVEINFQALVFVFLSFVYLGLEKVEI